MEQGARRRPVLKAVVGGVAAVGAVGGAARLLPEGRPSGPGHRRPALWLAGEESQQLSSLEVSLDGPVLARGGGRVWQTAALSSSRYSMVALTWRDPSESPSVQVRPRSEGRWGEWRTVPQLHDLPDRDSEERPSVGATDLVWIGPSDGVQVRVRGRRPRGLTLVLLHPWPQERDKTLISAAARLMAPGNKAAGAGAGLVPRPQLLGRMQWGANESWRNGEPRYNATIEQVHVHHTVNSNDYSEADVPALIRGMYRYHTHYLGWSDIAYNFLVDRFGRVWTGRAGGASRLVRGAHTLGFNVTSTGVSVIGNFELVAPSQEVVDAVAAVAAWKLQPFGRDPLATVQVTSEGSDKFRRDLVVSLPVIDGHRDTNDTACPGGHLYQALPEIQWRARALIDLYSKVTVVQPAVLTGVPALGQTLTATPGVYTPSDVVVSFVWLRDGVEVQSGGGAGYVVGATDVGAVLAVRVTASKDGLEPATETLTAQGPARSPALVTLDAVGTSRGRLRVSVEVASPPDVTAIPTGRVVVKVNERRAVVELSEGRGVARFGSSAPFKAGRYRIRARYLGDQAHDRALAQTRVRIPS